MCPSEGCHSGRGAELGLEVDVLEHGPEEADELAGDGDAGDDDAGDLVWLPGAEPVEELVTAGVEPSRRGR